MASSSRYTRDMRRLTTCVIVAIWCAPVLGCVVRERRPEGPYREAEEFADVLSDEAVDCTREHAPEGKGFVVVSAEFTESGKAPVIRDAGSMPGGEPWLECVRARAAEKLRSPKVRPAAFVRVRVPVPLVTSEVTYAFMQALPEEAD